MPLTLNGTSGITYPSGATQNFASFANATETTMSSDLTLTASSTQIQYVSATTTNLSVILPNATTLPTEGGTIFYIANSGANTVSIKDSSGFILGTVVSRQALEIYLISNSTSSGIWFINNTAPVPYIDLNFANPSSTFGVALTETTGVVISGSFGNTHTITAYTIGAGGVLTKGTPVTLSATGQWYFPIAVRVNNTTGVLTARGTGAVATYVLAFTVSGTTVTVGSLNTIVTASPPTTYAEYASVCRLSDTSILVVGPRSSDSTVNKIYTVSGTTLTETSSTTVGNSSTANSELCQPVWVSSNTVVWCPFTGRYGFAVQYSGTSITSSSIFEIAGTSSFANNGIIACTSLYPNSLIFNYGNTSTNNTVITVYTFSGTTATRHVQANGGVTSYGPNARYRISNPAPNIVVVGNSSSNPLFFSVTQSSATATPVFQQVGQIVIQNILIQDGVDNRDSSVPALADYPYVSYSKQFTF